MAQFEDVSVPKVGRFLVYDGKVYRITDMWLERQASDRERWGVVVNRKAEG